MKLNAEFRTLVDDQKFDEIESLWLENLEGGVLRADLHLPLLERMLRQGHRKRAEVLVQMLSDALAEADSAVQYEMLHEVAGFWPDCSVVRDALLANIRQRYGSKPNLQRILEHFRLEQAEDPVSTLDLVTRWLRFDVGSYVFMEKRGLGRVREINLGLGSIRVELDGNARPETFRIAEAEKLLEPLEEGHFLLRKMQDPEPLRQLAQENPGELLRLVFTSLQRPLTTPELKGFLDGIVESKRWATWWKKARNDGRVTVGSGTRPTVTWSESAADAEDNLWEAFEAARPAEQLDIFRQHTDRSEDLTQRFAENLAQLSRQMLRKNPALATEISLTLQMQEAQTEFQRLDPIPLLRAADGATLISNIGDRATREVALDLLRQHEPTWIECFTEIVGTETDARVLSRLYDALQQEAPKELEALVRETFTRPSSRPRFFVWLCREMQSRPELLRRADGPLLRRIIDALTDESFKGLHASLRELFDVGRLVDHIVKEMSDRQAAQVLKSLEREIGLEGHRKDSLARLIHQLHPHLEQDDSDILYVTRESIERKRAELEKLVKQDIPQNTEEIRKAAAHGDLRENFEYKSARDRQEMLSSRAKTLHDELSRVRALDASQIDASVVRVGTRITLQPHNASGEPRHLTILGPWDSDPERDVLSYLAPSIEPLLGRSPGDTVSFANQDWTVQKIDVWRSLDKDPT
jgi:transcription elongation GreA/GreB family factor